MKNKQENKGCGKMLHIEGISYPYDDEDIKRIGEKIEILYWVLA